jgi:zinc transport system substrate-binding protein
VIHYNRLRTARQRIAPLLFVAIATLAGGCDSTETPSPLPDAVPDLRLSMYAVNYPLAYFARRIGGDAVRVVLPVPPGVDPARWQPGPEDIVAIRQADLVLLNGAGYAAWINAADLPNNRLVDTSRGFRDRLIRLDDVNTSPGSEDVHSPGEMATYTWLDPLLAIEQARAILDALLTYRPAMENEFRSHLSLLERDLQTLDADLANAFGKVSDQGVLFSRPVYQYLERRFVPGARSLNWEPGRVPDAAALAELRALLVEYPATIMIWDSEPFAITVELLETEGLRSIAFETGANRPVTGNYLDLMHWNLANVVRLAPGLPGDEEPVTD